MKSLFCLTTAFIAVVCMSCGKEACDKLISFKAEDASAGVLTRVEAVTLSNLESFNVLAALSGSYVYRWTAETVSKEGSTYTLDKYWPASDPGYCFAASNGPLGSVDGDYSFVNVADMSTDIVAAASGPASYKAAAILSFRHILARVGGCRVEGDSCELSDIGISITPAVSGKYVIGGGSNPSRAPGSWYESSTGPAVLLNWTSGPGFTDNGIYMIPGTYTLSFSWTAEGPTPSGGYVLFTEGTVTNMTVSLGLETTVPVVSVSTSSWIPNNVIETF